MNDEILHKVDEINNIIESSKEYQKYLKLKELMDKDQELTELINKVRILQKDIVHHKIKKEELDKEIHRLNNYPLYREYQNTLLEINNVYGIIETSINKYFQNKMN